MTVDGDFKPYIRLDQAMVERGLAPSRSRATDAVSRGVVFVDNIQAGKPAQKVSPEAVITMDDPANGYVSRSALKLIAALDVFEFSPKGLKIIDIGASTGGFTQVLIQRDAAHVFAVDVGHDQLHTSIQQDARVTNMQGLNARFLSKDDIDTPLNAIVSDVSFISLKLALPPAMSMVEPGAWAALLVKPQFEVGRELVGRGGIVRDKQDGKNAADNIAAWINEMSGWCVEGLIECPITGGDGNQEYLLGARFNGH
ncbi:MAG: TlyA family RNA methyltransferase [Hyphomicrobiales bacterium]